MNFTPVGIPGQEGVTVLSQPTGSTVVLSEREDTPVLARLPQDRTGPARRVGSVGELARRLPLSSVDVLILDADPAPRGLLLADVGRLHVEYPEIQTAAVFSGMPPLEVVVYLVSCGVEVLIGGTQEEEVGGDRLAATVKNLRERARWGAASHEGSPPRVPEERQR
jgi:hypothetical protein